MNCLLRRIKLSAETIASSFGKVVSGDCCAVLFTWHTVLQLVQYNGPVVV